MMHCSQNFNLNTDDLKDKRIALENRAIRRERIEFKQTSKTHKLRFKHPNFILATKGKSL